MDELLLIALAGFAASIVDGSLGMGFGPTSSTILLSSGVPATSASAMVNLAKVATGAAGAASHWRLGNVDRRLVRRLALSGGVGAVVGVTVLASVDDDRIRPVLAVVLLVTGLRILLRFSRPLRAAHDDTARATDTRRVEIAGTAGGITNGLVGAWGPVVTPYLLQRGVEPRIAVGSVNTAEVAVAVVSVGSLLTADGADLRMAMVVAMLAGGVVAAPLAAHVIRFVPARALGIAVGALLVGTQLRELPVAGLPAYSFLAAAVVAAAARPRLAAGFSADARRPDRRPGRVPTPAGARRPGRRG